LEVFDDRFGKKATLIVSQVPIADWHIRFPDPTLADAILDRTIHNAYRLSLLGDSQRKLRGNRTMPHTSGTISLTSVFSLPTVRHAPVKVCDFTGFRKVFCFTKNICKIMSQWCRKWYTIKNISKILRQIDLNEGNSILTENSCIYNNLQTP